MSHHDHDHGDGHQHNHGHQHGDGHHHHHGEQAQEMTTAQKLEKLLDHWVTHNNDHATTYRTWADRAEKEGMADVAGLLRQAAVANEEMNSLFDQAREKL